MPRNDIGLFIPTTQIWDVEELANVNVSSPQFKELLIRMYQNINRMAQAINLKDSAYYDTSEFVNGQVFFPDALSPNLNTRQAYRMVVNFGALPNTGTKTVAHNIPVTAAYVFTRIYGTASKNASFIPIPYASATAINNIEINIDGVNVNITTSKDYSSYTTCYVILEYLKQ